MTPKQKKKYKKYLRVAEREKLASKANRDRYEQENKMFSVLVYRVREKALSFYINYLKSMLKNG